MFKNENLRLFSDLRELGIENSLMKQYLQIELKTTPQVVEFVKKTQV